MTQKAFTIPEIGLMLGTRVALGFGIGLLTSGKFSRDQRKGAGWALVGLGALTTIPIVISVITKPRVAEGALSLVA